MLYFIPYFNLQIHIVVACIVYVYNVYLLLFNFIAKEVIEQTLNYGNYSLCFETVLLLLFLLLRSLYSRLF